MTATFDAVPSEADGVEVVGAALLAGDMVGRYQVRRLVASGGMGRIYLARDTTLGRSVALKLVRPDLIDGQDTEGFVREAQITAQLNHPHIVQLYDVGRFGNCAYLALEFLEGESLRDRLHRENVSTDDGLRILRAIADALCHAHDASVFHCDLKPGNVMIPIDGRVRVVDFGLAIVRSSSGAVTRRGGTPDWMAPEQWRGDAVSDRTDVWALAVMTHQLLSGEHPFGAAGSADERRRHVLDQGSSPRPLGGAGAPEGLQLLALRSLSRDPLARPTARDWYGALDDALTIVSPVKAADNPFCGLAAFDERRASLFFGRDGDVDELVERLRESPVIPIGGPSGTGKSSFLLAGVIPRLRARGGWTTVVARPGSDPFTAVAHRLIAAIEDRPSSPATQELAEALKQTPSLLALRLATIAATRGGSVLLAIDQMEEIFTQGSSALEVERFLAMLASVGDATEPFRVVYTVRDDFLGRMSNVRDLFILPRLAGDKLRSAITAPLERFGYHFDNPAIVDDMMREIGDGMVELSLVQFACRALWDARDPERRLLLEAAYRGQGGVAGALARHAEHVIATMSADDQKITREMMGRLVVDKRVRRIIERYALLDGLPAAAPAVLDRLLAARLLVQQRPPGAHAFVVELAHESLLNNWRQLQRWLDESAEEHRLRAELDDAVEFWERRGARSEETWAEAELGSVRHRVDELRLTVSPRIERFLAAGEARQRDLRKRARRRRGAAFVVAFVVASVAIVLASWFRDQKLRAESQAAALDLAGGNTGEIVLELRPFEWRDGAPITIDAAELPTLAIALYQHMRHDLDLPGAPVPDSLVTITVEAPGRYRIEAPGGIAYLRIHGRGRGGERCAASWLRLNSLPGYAQRGVAERIVLEVPTCAASAAGMIAIPAGDFVYGGPGVPPTAHADYQQAERTVHLAAYAIDRTELSNAAYAPFARAADHTGHARPQYPDNEAFRGADAPVAPLADIDAFQAEAVCRYWGKRLPTDEEWTKAARGGLVLAGGPNPEPRRLYPWLGGPQPCVNLAGDADGHAWMAPVDAFVCGASPYGVLNLAGNVQEWIARHGQTSTSALRVVRGGSAFSPAEYEHGTTIYRNAREARKFDFTIGVRCVADANPEEGTSWQSH